MSYPQRSVARQKYTEIRVSFLHAINRLRICWEPYAPENDGFSLYAASVHKSARACPESRAVSAHFVYKGFDRVDLRLR
jgi:hypothetical protein